LYAVQFRTVPVKIRVDASLISIASWSLYMVAGIQFAIAICLSFDYYYQPFVLQ